MAEELLNDGFPFADGVLDGQTAFVCGASKGIGRACALMLARAGARVEPAPLGRWRRGVCLYTVANAPSPSCSTRTYLPY